jgi:ADP-heptose:LPS heptosyltransferase
MPMPGGRTSKLDTAGRRGNPSMANCCGCAYKITRAIFLRTVVRLLFITATRIGDAVLGTGALRYALQQWPEARVTIACGPEAAALYGPVPNLDEIIVLEKRPWAGHWVDLWRRTATRYWSRVIDGRRSAAARLMPHGRIWSMPVKRPGEHAVEQVSRMMKAERPLDPYLWTADHHEQAAAKLIPPGGPVLAVAPMANWPGKVWPAERFQEAIGILTGAGGRMLGARVAVFGAPSEREAAQRVLENVPNAQRIELAGKVDLLTAFACLKRCDFFIGNDSGLMHMAAASGTPTVGLFGPSKDEHYAPWGALTAVARTPMSFDEIVSQPGYDKTLDRTWMDTLTVESAMTAVDGLLDRVSRAAAE